MTNSQQIGSSDNKIEQYVLLAKGLRGMAVVNVIEKATAAAGIYTFGELQATPSVQDLARSDDPKHAAAISLLRLFSYGTWKDYAARPSDFAELAESQQRKLKALTIASMAASRRTLPYGELMACVDAGSVRELEDLIITDCIYAGCVRGRLDQRGQCLHVEHALARDVPPEGISRIVESLEKWLSNAKEVMEGLEAQVRWAGDATTAAVRCREDREKSVQVARDTLRAVLEAKAQHDAAAMAFDEADMIPLEEISVDDPQRPAGLRLTKRRR